MSGKAFLDYEGLTKYNERIQSDLAKLGSIPAGVILAYHNADGTIPAGWAICDGQNGTPDLRGRFILGASESRTAGSKGGSETHTLTVDELPAHTHTVSGVTITESTAGGSLFSGGEDEISPGDSSISGATGKGAAIDMMPPYYVLVYIMKLP